jgi:molybdenum cofactor cytidylyltransferase
MNLIDAIRITEPIKLAVVGAGGKSSLIFSLARQLSGKCIITTTTHISIEQSLAGDLRFIDDDPDLIEKIKNAKEHSVIVVVGTEAGIDRVNGPTELIMHKLKEICEKDKISLLIEADGSKKLFVKAHAEHEPVIPDWVDIVVHVVSWQAIGKKVDSESIFRIDYYRAITEQKLGEYIDLHSICKLLVHPLGGMKGIGSNKKSVIFFNHFPNSSEMDDSIEFNIQTLLKFHDQVIFGYINQYERNDKGIAAVYEKDVAVILAAGGSFRMGDILKQSLPFEGETFLRRISKTILNCHSSKVVIVLGCEYKSLLKEVEDLPVEIIHNTGWENGQSTSVISAVKHLQNDKNIGGTLFIPVDQPFLDEKTIQQVVRCHTKHIGKVIVPKYGNTTGSPVYFDKNYFEKLLTLTGDMGGRALLKEVPHIVCEISNGRALFDIDTMDEYRNLIEK